MHHTITHFLSILDVFDCQMKPSLTSLPPFLAYIFFLIYCFCPGIFAGKLSGVSHVSFTDRDPSVLELVEHAITSQHDPLKASYSLHCFDWGTPLPSSLLPSTSPSSSSSSIVILCSDVIYNKAVVEPLFHTFNQCLPQYHHLKEEEKTVPQVD